MWCIMCPQSAALESVRISRIMTQQQARHRPMAQEGFGHLLRAASDCVEVCNDIRRVSEHKNFAYASDSARDLSLSLATLDRLLFDFVDRLVQQAGHPPLKEVRLSDALEKYACHADDEVIVDTCARIRQVSNSTQLKQLPPGGIVSILYHFASSLDDIKKVLRMMRSSSWDRWGRHVLPSLGLLFAFMKLRANPLRAALKSWKSLSFVLFSVLWLQRRLHKRYSVRHRLNR